MHQVINQHVTDTTDDIIAGNSLLYSTASTSINAMAAVTMDDRSTETNSSQHVTEEVDFNFQRAV